MSASTKALDFTPVWVWGVPFAPWTMTQALDAVDRLIAAGEPAFFITANLHYCMLTAQDARLPPLNEQAAFIVADGMPIVWAARRQGQPLPERVTGADMVPALCQRAAQKGHRVYFLGGAPGIAEAAAQVLSERFPGLVIAGTECPPFRPPTPEEHEQQLARIRAAKADLLFLAFGQPRGELWLAENIARLGIPAAVQIGASLDFVAGKVQRAPKWIQRSGMEWFYRITREPLRMGPRYWRNGLFLLRMVMKDAFSRRAGGGAGSGR